MRAEADKAVDALNGFLRGKISAVETYRQAIEKLGSSPNQLQLEDCRRSHELRVAKLRNRSRVWAESRPRTPVPGAASRGWSREGQRPSAKARRWPPSKRARTTG